MREVTKRLHGQAEVIGRLTPVEQAKVLELLGDAFAIIQERLS